MNRSTFILIYVASALLETACGKDAPAAPTPTPAPAQTTITGTVSLTGGARVPNATVRIFDGANAGRSTLTNASGEFLLDNLTPSNANVTANATIYDEVVIGAFLNGAVTMNFIFPIPACQTNNTGSVSFGNRSAAATQRIVWDGGLYAILGPGATSAPLTATAGIAHPLQFLVSPSNALACSNSSPILTQCERGRVITCSFP